MSWATIHLAGAVLVVGCTPTTPDPDECAPEPETTDGSDGTTADTAVPRDATGSLSVTTTGFGFTGFIRAQGPTATITIPWDGEGLRRLAPVPAGSYQVVFVERYLVDLDADWDVSCREYTVEVPEEDSPADGAFVASEPLTEWWYYLEDRCGAPYGE